NLGPPRSFVTGYTRPDVVVCQSAPCVPNTAFSPSRTRPRRGLPLVVAFLSLCSPCCVGRLARAVVHYGPPSWRRPTGWGYSGTTASDLFSKDRRMSTTSRTLRDSLTPAMRAAAHKSQVKTTLPTLPSLLMPLPVLSCDQLQSSGGRQVE